MASYLDEIRLLQERWRIEDYFDIKTSGTTGVPKIIQHSKEAMRRSALKTIDRFDLRAGDKLLVCLPIKFVAGMMMVLRSEVLGGELVAIEPSTSPLSLLEQSIDFAALTPMQLNLALQNHPEKIDLVKTIILGGAPISMNLAERIDHIDSNITKVYHTYGMTETITHVAVKALNGSYKSQYYTALDGVRFTATVDERLIISADHISQESIITNDVVELIDDNHFKWRGRADNVINSGGLKIFPLELEQLIRPYLKQQFFISHTNDDILGQKIVLVIKEDPNATIIPSDLLGRLKSKLPTNKSPKTVFVVKDFLWTSTGKIVKDLNKYNF